MAGWPVGYPRRGAWRFRNVRRDFGFWPTLESIEVIQEYPDMVATFSCEVEDNGEGYEFEVEDEVRAFFQKAGQAEVRIFSGHLKVVELEREDEHGPRKWRLEAQDYTAKLGDAIIRQRAHRKKESALRRIRWIVSYLDNAWHLDGHDYDVPNEEVEREDMYGMTVAEALDSVANEVGLRYWIDLDNTLNVHKTKTIAAPFDLDNDAPDYSTSFPFREFTWRRDSTDIANAVLVEPEKRDDSRWATAPANIAQYEWGDSTGRQERFISDEEIRTARAAERKADVQLQRLKVYDSEGTLICYEPGLYAGMHVGLVEALWDIDITVRIIRVVITAVDPHDTDGTALLRSELTVTNKPHRRSPKMGRGDLEAGGTADTTPKVVDGFSRTVAPASWTEGDAITAPLFEYTAGAGLDVYLDPIPFGVGGTSWTGKCGSWIGAWYLGTDCFYGWKDAEVWWHFLVPSHPVGAAGVIVTLAASDPSGVGATYGARIVTNPGEPTATWQGTTAGVVKDGETVDVFIPVALVPAGGDTMHIGAQANWKCDYALGEAGYCAWQWPVNSGAGNSGNIRVQVTDVAWAIVVESNDGWGSTEDGHEWQDAGTEGAPVAGMDGESLYVEGPGGQGIYLQGERDAEGEADGAWSDVSWATEVRFTTDALTDGGSITLTTTGQGAQTVGVIDLGAAPSISVAAPTTADTAAAPIGADEVWVAKFDSRSGDFRAKAWQAGTQEPAEWDAEVVMSETEDDSDRFEMWVRAATGQTIRVLDITSYAAARPGQQVITEWLGVASGDTNRLKTNHRYRDGTLIPLVLGVTDPAIRESGATTEFDIDYLPTAGSGIHASYIAAGDDDG